MLGFSRAAVFGGTQFEASEEFLIEVADNQLGHETTLPDSPGTARPRAFDQALPDKLALCNPAGTGK